METTQGGIQAPVDEDGTASAVAVLSADSIWKDAAEQLRSELKIGNFSAWFGHSKAVGLDGRTFVLGVASPFAKEWIEGHYLEQVRTVISTCAGTDLDVVLLADETFATDELEGHAAPVEAAAPVDEAVAARSYLEEARFHPKYNFDSFVIGSSNRFAHAAALAVAETPAQSYNPLFIYGGAGLGKTHLLQAIGRYVRECHPGSVVRYISTEQFMNEFIVALRRQTIPDFHRRYRVADLLLVDDIQFLEGKERTQEEFFHTFNSLYPKSQVVISSDRPPKKIPTLEERLRTRFEWGLITDIQPPDLETRLAILQKKAETESLTITDEALSFIAERIQTNIRELEGALIRVGAYASLTHQEPNVELAQNVLQALLPHGEEGHVTSDLVMSVAADYFGVTTDEIRSSSRSRDLVTARQMAMYLCRELTDLSLPKIGDRFGGRDHSTVIYANNKIRELIGENQRAYEQVKELTTRIRQQAARG
ncbi:MAG: chromosomal replication initiator protein [Actinomycetota bacterium]|jgi:chromosomal replication initiator protein|nr:chromosomal replication initiator protein [Actinomycetota bacterium]